MISSAHQQELGRLFDELFVTEKLIAREALYLGDEIRRTPEGQFGLDNLSAVLEIALEMLQEPEEEAYFLGDLGFQRHLCDLLERHFRLRNRLKFGEDDALDLLMAALEEVGLALLGHVEPPSK